MYTLYITLVSCVNKTYIIILRVNTCITRRDVLIMVLMPNICFRECGRLELTLRLPLTISFSLNLLIPF